MPLDIIIQGADAARRRLYSENPVPVTGGAGAIFTVQVQERPPTHATKTNPSYVLTYVAGDLTTVDLVTGGITYRKTLTYAAGDLTAVSAWVQI
jgi:hypothetical protein